MPLSSSPTNETTRLILEYFFKKGIYAKRHSVSAGSAAYRNKEGISKTRYFQSGITGGSDIFVWLPPYGRFLGIEIKTGKDRLRPEQEGFIQNIQAMGCYAMVVKDFNDFLRQFENLSLTPEPKIVRGQGF